MGNQLVTRTGEVYLDGRFVGRTYREGTKWHHSYPGSAGYRTRHDAVDALYQAKKAVDEPLEAMERALDERHNPSSTLSGRRVVTTSGRKGQLTGFRDASGNLYVQFDDGSLYSVPSHAIRYDDQPDPEPQAEDQALTVTYDSDARHFRATRAGEVVAFAKWSGPVLRVFLPGGTFVGRMFRSDGKIIAGEIVYTYRAETGTDPLQIVGGEREVARRATMSDAIALLLAAAANARREAEDQADEPATSGKTLGEMTPAERAAVIKRAADRLQAELQANAEAIGTIMDEAEAPASFEVGARVTVVDDKYGRYVGQLGTVVEHPDSLPADVHADVWVVLDSQDARVAAVGFDADQVTGVAEPCTIDGQPACGAPVDGGRCDRAPGHEGHPHIKEPRTEAPLETAIYRAVLNTRRGQTWTYSYTSPVHQDLTRGDGTPYVIEPGQLVAYGTRLGDLRSMLRCRYDRQLQITETWKH